ncbi:hypothetical protein RJT34_32156 [Clitoria ternatea]|uniref:Uncharacterized protein n=1 Tax=Clitoria ternatea TaxID=43366 RepID=A0AAN9I3H9_CLITE
MRESKYCISTKEAQVGNTESETHHEPQNQTKPNASFSRSPLLLLLSLIKLTVINPLSPSSLLFFFPFKYVFIIIDN